MTRKIAALALTLILGTLLLSSCGDMPRKGIGRITQDETFHQNDIGRASGISMWKFDYTLKAGNHYTHIWLEHQSAETSTPKLLTSTGTNSAPASNGSLVVGLSDPATTKAEENKTWRFVISRRESAAGQEGTMSAEHTSLFPNPLLDASGNIFGLHMTIASENSAIELDKEITLIRWIAGPSLSTDPRDIPARAVSLKMKVIPRD